MQLCVDARQEFLGKAAPDSAGEHESVGTMVANQHGSEVSAASLKCVTADNELLRFGDFEFDPGAAPLTAFVD